MMTAQTKPNDAAVMDSSVSEPHAVATACPACSNGKRVEAGFHVENDIPLYHCSQCGLGALDIKGADHEGFDEYWTEINQKIYADPAVIQELTDKYRHYYSKVISKVPSKRFLDVGSGAGISIGAAASLGFEATGIEPSSYAVALSRKRFDIPVVEGLLHADDDLPRDYGMLALWDVIEHVIDPQELLDACNKHLAKGGVLLLETPDEATLLRGMLRFFGNLGIRSLDKRCSIYYRAHRFYFTRAAMTSLLTRCGFEQIEFFGEHTMFEKELLKKKLYGRTSPMKMFFLRMTFAILKRLPFMANKMVVAAVKK
jgi:2-polyprenyl-3-methyl-5-hydroxy-6-metoxy-1,4-benzoquinol methylase